MNMTTSGSTSRFAGTKTQEDAMLLLRQHQSHLKRSHECFFNVEESWKGEKGGGDETVEMKMRTCYVVVDKSARCK